MVLQLDQGQARAHRPSDPHVRRPPRRHHRGRGRRYRRGPGAERHLHRRHAVRRRQPDRAGEHHLPRAGDLPWRSSRRRPPIRTRWARRCASCPKKTRPSACSADENTGQTIISGMGELHLEVLVDRMLREFKVQANVGRPRVAYRESITRAGAQGRVPLRQANRRARPVRPRRHLRLEPGEPGTGVVFENKIVGGTIPQGVSSRRSRKACARRPRAACWPAIR